MGVQINILTMFHSALLKLTLLYVLIVMIISISFSVVLYNVSSRELDRGLGNQTKKLRNMPPMSNPFIEELEKMHAEQINESAQTLQQNLIYFNLIILVSATLGCYFLAKISLRPIEESMEAQNRFTADASHELRTPLTAMKAEIEVNLRDKNMDIKEARELLNSNLEEISKLEYLSSALLKLAKFDKENKKDFEKINLAESVELAIEKVNKIADQKSITISAKLKKVEILGDQQSLTELFIILLDNAIKYSPKASKIAVEIKKHDRHIEVIFTDHGVGIKASDIPHIFQRFYRADVSRSKEKVDGYGLGLSIAKRIAELHEGDILVSSQAGKGSKFTVKL